MPDFYHIIRDFLTERYTLRLSLGIQDADQPKLFVEIFNQTKDVPLVVRQVRVHYGNNHYSHYFRLIPHEGITIPPKHNGRFVLSYEPLQTVVGRRHLSKTLPIEDVEQSGPSFDSPANLFNAIGMGKTADSWIEVDFNQYAERRYKKGKIKSLFNHIGQTMRHRREGQEPKIK